jgi:hypothetical protein
MRLRSLLACLVGRLLFGHVELVQLILQLDDFLVSLFWDSLLALLLDRFRLSFISGVVILVILLWA